MAFDCQTFVCSHAVEKQTLHWLGVSANVVVHFLFEHHPHALTPQELSAPAIAALLGGTAAMAFRILSRSNKKLEEAAPVLKDE